MSSHSSGNTILPYIGRFAPSPSGPLHFGSLVCALASYLDAKQHHGLWLVRIEDIDPPREQKGADKLILDALHKHGLHWDGTPLYQSSRSEAYQAALLNIHSLGLSYRCNCTRKRLAQLNYAYDGHCRTQAPPENAAAAIRLNTSLIGGVIHGDMRFQDALQGETSENFSESGDFVIHRKDGLFAYQLAVTVDDIDQNITHVVRGSDLLDSTPKQLLLFKAFSARPPSYAHIPVIVDEYGNKLSKQNHAPALDCAQAFNNLKDACNALELHPPDSCKTIEQLLKWATEHWQIDRLKNQKQRFLC